MPDFDVFHTLLACGVVLLCAAGLLGFAQARQAPGSDGHALWRVAHAGGTAGAVQLIALAAVWQHFAHHGWSWIIGLGVIVATWAFFVGPTLRAMGAAAASRVVNLVGAVFAAPSYLALPLLLVP